MKMTRAARWTGGALIALMAFGAQAQPGSGVLATPGGARDMNRQLEYAVSRSLSRTSGLDATGIAVRAHDGRVTLQGRVPDQSQAALALRTAQRVQGVRSVQSQLVVRASGR